MLEAATHPAAASALLVRSAEQVVVSGLEALADAGSPRTDDERRTAVQDMLAFAEKHRLTLGEGIRIRDLIHEGHKY